MHGPTTAVAAGLLATAVLSGCAGRPASREGSPKSEGYTAVGTVHGMHIWLDVRDPSSTGIRTTGAYALCNERTSGPPTMTTPLCDSAVAGVGTVVIFLVGSDVDDVQVLDDEGETLSSAGAVSLGQLVPGKKLIVMIVPHRDVQLAGGLRFS